MINFLGIRHLPVYSQLVPGLMTPEDRHDLIEFNETAAVPVEIVYNLLHLNLVHGQT